MPTSDEELETRLQELLKEAHGNGVDVEGGWTCRNGPEHPDWEVVVTEVRTGDAAVDAVPGVDRDP